MLLTVISAWTMCFWFFPFSMFLCREMGSPPSREGQWLDTELQGKQEAHTKQPASRAACLLTLAFVILPTSLWMSSSTPEMIYAMTFPGRFLLPLGWPAREPEMGSRRHTDQWWWVINILYSHKIFAAWVLFVCLPLPPTSCCWTGISCSSMKKIDITDNP